MDGAKDNTDYHWWTRGTKRLPNRDQRDHRVVEGEGVAHGDNGGEREVERNSLVALLQRSLVWFNLQVPSLQRLLVFLCLRERREGREGVRE